MINHWEQMKYWESGDWQAAREKLDNIDGYFNPSRDNLFRALDLTPFESVKVCIVGQDPYPNPSHATGVAFSIPKDLKVYPPTLANILVEYMKDLEVQVPTSGNLEKWCSEGVLLWNATPTCATWKPASHSDWEEWVPLTREIVWSLSARKGVVFAFLGARAREYAKLVDTTQKNGTANNCCLETSHPSPLSASPKKRYAVPPFRGSRLFSTINAKLRSMKKETVDWSL